MMAQSSQGYPNRGRGEVSPRSLAMLAKLGYTVDWIEDWDLYHRLSGEVHCGSNTKRALPASKWWESVQ